MKFGKSDSPEEVDYTLPEVSGRQSLLTQDEHPVNMYMGGSKWGNKGWTGLVYPEKARVAHYLHHYSRAFNSVELNASGYGLHTLRSLEQWVEQVPNEFRFSPKFPRTVSHYGKLSDRTIPAAIDFITRVKEFETKLGMPFLQMHESFSPDDQDLLEKFITEIAQLHPFAIELRHPDWFSAQAYSETADLFRENDITWVITDTAGRRDVLHASATNERLFVRFVGTGMPNIDKGRLLSWAEQLKQFATAGVRDIYFYIHNTPDTHVPFQNVFLLKQLGAHFASTTPIKGRILSLQESLY